MASLTDINWGGKGTKKPISKTHPYTFTHFSNPKKRKVEDEAFSPVTLPVVGTVSTVNRKQHSAPAVSHHERLLRLNMVIQAYLSLIFNIFIVCIVILLVIKAVVAVRHDIGVRLHASVIDQKARISECRRQYVMNKCAPGQRVPAVEQQCQEWEKCMKQDPVRQELVKIILRLLSEGAEELMGALSVRSVLLASLSLILVLKFRR